MMDIHGVFVILESSVKLHKVRLVLKHFNLEQLAQLCCVVCLTCFINRFVVCSLAYVRVRLRSFQDLLWGDVNMHDIAVGCCHLFTDFLPLLQSLFPLSLLALLQFCWLL